MDFKSSEVYKVTGKGLKTGKFISKDGKEISITPDIIDKIYSNINGHIPYVLGHSTHNPEIIGYAYKVGKGTEDNFFTHEGFVFNKKKEIGAFSSDKISPEIDFTFDSSGSLIDASLHALSFVPNPAIDDTKVEIQREVFSNNESPSTSISPDGIISMTTDKTIATDQSGGLTNPSNVSPSITTIAPPSVIPPAPITQQRVNNNDSVTPVTIVDIAQYEDRIKDLEGKLTESVAFKEKILKERYDSVVNELKSVGIDDVSSIVNGLPVEQKINVLVKMKENIVKKAPIAAPSNDIVDSSSTLNTEKQLTDALNEIHISREYYDKVMNKKKGSNTTPS